VLADDILAALQRDMTRKLLLPLLLAFALSSAACTKTGNTPPAAGSAATPAASPGRSYTPEEDRAYCGQLAGLYLRYVGSIGSRILPNADVTEAINDCAQGNYAAGIPVLEKVLRESDFTLPTRS
jgi:hypothetical protein